MSSPTSKPRQQEELAEPRPDVEVGDELFFNHPQGAMSGRVVCHGAHGVTLKTGDTTHKIRWQHILGHKKRSVKAYQVHESGEDGQILRDAQGRRKYMAIPNEAYEDPLVAKADKPGGPIRPGLTKKVITEKTGKQNTHWVRTGEDPKKERKKTAPEAPAGRAKPGAKVKFKLGTLAGEGEVVGKPGRDGAHVRDASGHVHKVKWDQIDSKPTYAPRDENESDKAYAKRAVDTQDVPHHLPEEHDKYFHTEGATHVPLEHLHSTKEGNEKDGENARKRMAAAAHGVIGKRPPITVAPHPEKKGQYKVLDGNGTLAGARQAGFKHLPVNVVNEADYRAKEAAKQVVDPDKFKDLPKKVLQPGNTQDAVYSLAEAGLSELKDWLDRGLGVASRLGFKTMQSTPGDVPDGDWDKPGGMLFIAPLKGAERAAEKVDGDYGGNWNQLTDVVRCTLAVDDLHEMRKVMESLKESGMKVAQIPKNRFLKPTSEGYMDINLIVTMPNGCQAEVQLNIKDMLRAKNVGHPFYEVTRKLDNKYDKTPKDQWDSGDITKYQDAIAEQERIYSEAYLKHIKTHYDSEPNMIKSLRRVILILQQ